MSDALEHVQYIYTHCDAAAEKWNARGGHVDTEYFTEKLLENENQ